MVRHGYIYAIIINPGLEHAGISNPRGWTRWLSADESSYIRVGRAGGYSAAFLVMQGMGLMQAKAEPAEPSHATPGSGKGVKVVILGAGIAGLVSAYEMRALGYECTLLECRERPGGRNWTVRGGDRVTFMDGTTQTCTWDEGNYQNFGPGRLPVRSSQPCWATAKNWASPCRSK